MKNWKRKTMSKIHFISYSEDRMYSFKESRERMKEEAVQFGEFDSITFYNESDLSDSLKETLKPALKYSRGAGCWIWKPFIIQKRLREIDEGDFLIYTDMGITINKHGKKNFQDLLEMVKGSDYGNICFQIGHKEKNWCTKEILDYFKCSNDEQIKNSDQYYAGVLLFYKNKKLIKLIDEWCDIAYNNPLLFTDEHDDNQENGFIENRHDQAVFSILRKSKNIKPIIYDPVAYGPWELEKAIDAAFWNLHLRS